ncbi:MAG: hypothetical protein IH795_04185 [Bacteroidetes bacterium]|nr:hypothetical protein [Bacteroidota bacterium]
MISDVPAFTLFPFHFYHGILGMMVLQVVYVTYVFLRAHGKARQSENDISIPAASIPIIILFSAALTLFLGVRGTYIHDLGTILPIIIGVAVPISVGLLLLLVPGFRAVVDRVDVSWLMAIQTFRVFGYIFLILFDLNMLSKWFALGAGYGDILVGLLAPVATYLWVQKTRHAKSFAIFWNVLGIIDFLVIAVPLYLISLPALNNVGPNSELMNYFPMVMIPTFIAPFFIVLHFYSLRIILRTGKLKSVGKTKLQFS